MNEHTRTSEFALQVGAGAHDPLEDEVRQRVRGFIEVILEEELQTALGRCVAHARRRARVGNATATGSGR